MEEVDLVPDQGPIQQFRAAGLYAALHERVHPRNLHTGIGHQGVEGGREFGVAVADGELRRAVCAFEAHEEFRPSCTIQSAVGCAQTQRIRMRLGCDR
ncbi:MULTISPECIES: hypothetical protein [Streptomyces violaceusniger group]|uniref:hypothetical protein n=1 Tax=Streptomyces violaceusniger group TaxID=2839105 RepID=UPI001ABFADB8|nr:MULTISPECIES: hypothetical protein [Streptomyces violaceusniger group]